MGSLRAFLSAVYVLVCCVGTDAVNIVVLQRRNAVCCLYLSVCLPYHKVMRVDPRRLMIEL